MQRCRQGDGRERGGALLIAVIAIFVLAGISLAMLTVGTASKREHVAATESLQALYVAEAGLSDGIASLTVGGVPNLGTVDTPLAFSSGSYWGTSVPVDAQTTTLTVYGKSRGTTRGLEAVVVKTGDGIYANAVFAGNSSGDATYQMKFGGSGASADDIAGNVYSGGNILINGNATITGTPRAMGVITGGTGDTGSSEPTPNLPAMNYPVHHDIDVAAALSSPAATYTANAQYGGSAWQLPESDPAHIFRKNPSDRAVYTSGTAKDDYFLEDPYEPINRSAVTDPSAGSHVTISGIGGEPGPNGNDLVYYIDGNLWIHNLNAYSFTLWNSDNTPIKLTIVVRGNIYVSDNIFYNNPHSDGLAMLALKDPSVTDSGNIYFGDPTFGTLEEMDAFMYAENNFYDNNLSASGSASVTVRGNMTAGNQVRINRDFGAAHSKLTVDFDSRIFDHNLSLPGLPDQSGSAPTWTVKSWREVGAP